MLVKSRRYVIERGASEQPPPRISIVSTPLGTFMQYGTPLPAVVVTLNEPRDDVQSPPAPVPESSRVLISPSIEPLVFLVRTPELTPAEHSRVMLPAVIFVAPIVMPL